MVLTYHAFSLSVQRVAAATLQAATEDDEEDWENVSDKISARLLVKGTYI